MRWRADGYNMGIWTLARWLPRSQQAATAECEMYSPTTDTEVAAGVGLPTAGKWGQNRNVV